MPAFKDLTGMTFGNVYVNSRAPNKRTSKRTTFVMWNCTCMLCGNHFISRGNNLTSGNTTSDGCNNKECISKAQLEDLSGQRFGKLVVICRAPDKIRKDGGKRTVWKCKCDCGNEVEVVASRLKDGQTQSCGCYAIEYRSNKYSKDLTNMRFGHLVALSRVTPPGQAVKWKCKCDCGNEVVVRTACLRKGLTQSCGCKMFSIGAEKVALWLKDNSVQYKTEYKFKDLYSGNHHYLRFDFAIMDSNKLSALIEYQGQQHYKETINSEFGKRQREVTDQLKRDYCKENNIKLFEIKYNENIEVKMNEIMQQIKQVNPVPSSSFGEGLTTIP